MSVLNVQIPEKLEPLLAPARYKAAHGGRGGAKSHFFGQLAVIKNYSEPLHGVCIREVQDTIRDSVKRLIEAKIKEFGLGDFFECLTTEIRGKNGSLIIFKGMQDYNADNIKSLEGFDWAWVEEAQSLSHRSLDLLRPTIRKPGSEIWFSWNPRYDTDAVDELFRGPNPPKNSTVIEINWPENPWFPEVLEEEKDRDYEADPDKAEHVWGGGYQTVTEGAYYARLLKQAERAGRIGDFPYDPRRQKVTTAWDLGIDDFTAIWFIADDGRTPVAVDYYEVSGDGFDEIVATALPEVFVPPTSDEDFERFAEWSELKALRDLRRKVPFIYRQHFLPHDVKVREQGAGGRHRYQIFQSLGVKPIKKGIATNPSERVAAGRMLLPIMYFDANPNVLHGIKRLRQYQRKKNDQLNTYTTPLHDDNSHGADAFGEYALNTSILPVMLDEAPKQSSTEIPHTVPNEHTGRQMFNPDIAAIIEAKAAQRRRDAV